MASLSAVSSRLDVGIGTEDYTTRSDIGTVVQLGCLSSDVETFMCSEHHSRIGGTEKDIKDISFQVANRRLTT